MTDTENSRRGRHKIPPNSIQAIVQRLKVGRMPRSDTRLGKLCRQVEERLYCDLGPDPDAADILKVGLVLQLVVCIAGLPLLTPKKQDVHPAYKWAVDTLRGLLNELYPGKAKGPKPPPRGAQSDVAAAVLAAFEDEDRCC